jgi:hypothetical protein
MERITRKAVDGRAEFVSALLRDGLRVVPEGRYGYIGLDLYDAHGMVRTLSTGLTKRQAYDYLGAMLETLDIVGRDTGR